MAMEKQGIVPDEQPPSPPRKGTPPATKSASASCCGGRCKTASASTQDAVANAVRDAAKR